MTFRIGSGYDVHALVHDVSRKLILGGVTVPFDKVLRGHSDADVLVHSVCDAILGAAGLGDIGRHFPDSDPLYKDISSLILLKRCANILNEAGYAIENIDTTVFAQAPKLEPYKDEMSHKIASTIEISPESVNVKATTTEGLGFEGRGEGIAAHAVVLIRKISKKSG
ncbi:2-C-methyl-D-erythritol 2,4-cyclodiphosphate synthase [Desulfamplus magnetovallimortis]|uniref:2-C-methyl-D-erythritol 2,4-cyclodiphosphate synthase n=1 Tax=Desulfamplus magnetovallimortis TaxID=1246637 RepID=A0A1W1H7W2_9BACT|nr:2-C-methyl-D-erythritol 2,4-cyclodiphosphate synthase [Desulfamplus magnetovallimortis]SLM28562.1 2-C-methyl-D-erythritol 2,4-cyclodiphosphate synthase [Desulfamplus magnetovallimortis]